MGVDVQAVLGGERQSAAETETLRGQGRLIRRLSRRTHQPRGQVCCQVSRANLGTGVLPGELCQSRDRCAAR